MPKKHAQQIVGRVVGVHPLLSKSGPAAKAAPPTVADVVRTSGRDADSHDVGIGGRSIDVRLGESAAPSLAEIREAHRANRLDGEISDREGLEVIDVLRAASTAARSAS